MAITFFCLALFTCLNMSASQDFRLLEDILINSFFPLTSLDSFHPWVFIYNLENGSQLQNGCPTTLGLEELNWKLLSSYGLFQPSSDCNDGFPSCSFYTYEKKSATLKLSMCDIFSIFRGLLNAPFNISYL